MMKYVWVFNGSDNSSFPSAIFKKKKKAILWVKEHKLSGILTRYPIDIPLFQWAIENNYFILKNELQKNSKAIGNFNSAYLKHYHFENGE